MLSVALLIACSLSLSQGTLPPGCIPLEEQPLDSTDPSTIFGTNSELNSRARPIRVGNLRQRGALPTGHFITNQIKDHPVPLRLFPYEAVMTSKGITYDAYTMERWWDPKRTDEMQQQSAWQAGQPWHRLTSMGTNLKQMVAGPDGNPTATFSGIQYKEGGSTSPSLVVRQKDEIPDDLFLDNISSLDSVVGNSGIRVGIAGSGEPEMTDFGDVYANFMYSGNGGSMEVPIVRGAPLLTHLFKNANPIIKPMCLSSFDGKQITFDCSKENSVADAGIGHISATCSGSTLHLRMDNSKPIADVTKLQWAAETKSAWMSGRHVMHNCNQNTCRLSADRKRIDIDVPNMHGQVNFAVNYIGHFILPWDWINHPEETNCNSKRKTTEERGVNEIAFCADCSEDGMVEVTVELGTMRPNVSIVQIALESSDHWANPPAMRTCQHDTCEIHGSAIVARRHVDSKNLNIAVNVIGSIVLPHSHWVDQPCQFTCGGPSVCSGPMGRCVSERPTQPTQQTQHTTQHHQLHTQATHPSLSQTHQTQQSHLVTSAPTSNYPGTQNTGQTHPHVHVTPGKKFLLELNEPGDELPNQTRKYLIYFSQAVTAHINHGDDTISFTALDGRTYNGIMQLAYLGAGLRGDHSNDTVLDNYLGVYSYKPKASYCVSESANTAYANFDWRPNLDHAESVHSQLLMITLPHHDLLLGKTSPDRLRDTVYTFKGYEGDSWLLEMDLPRASMEPDSAAVHTVQQNRQQLQDILAAVDRDTKNSDLNGCSHGDSYGVGKAVGLFARLGSISRAFNTNHYVAIDNTLKNCLEKWLRIDDSLDDIRKFKYELVWGGLFLRQTHGDLNYGTDYGFPYYNDHHFHLGYFLYAIAYIVKHHPDWGTQHKSRIYTLARDVGNPSYNDRHFPVARQKDMFMGFSWATGIVPGQRQEESSSEALNCYHGLAALGDAYNDDHLKHTGQVLLAMEILSVREYWHVRSHNEAHFPPTLRDYGVVGQIAEDEFYVYTLDWGCAPNVFPMRHGCLVGIQIIPITAVSKYWMDKDWASHILKTCTMAIDPTQARDYHLANPSDLHQLNQGWKAFCYAAMAPYDAEHARMAAEFVKDKTPRNLVGGTGAASTLLFIYGRT